jgi:Signal peptidase, peptidase S26
VATTLLLTLLAVFLTMLLVHGVLLWLVCKICRVRRPADGRGVGPVRALLVAGGFAVLNLSIILALWYGGIIRQSSSEPLAASLAFAAAGFLLLLLWLRLTLPVTFPRALAVGTLWSVVGAGIGLAAVLGLRSYVAEAFIVPTGAMADNIHGYHKRVTCPSCGFAFAVNCTQQIDPVGGPPAHVWGCTCPNCRQIIRFNGAPPGPFGPDAVEAPDPPPTGGDRILVGKGLFGADRYEPQRHDVMVFEHTDPNIPMSRPITDVKRLVGLPGETLALCGGKLYALPADLSPGDDEAKVRELFRAGKFGIARRSPEQILAMRQIVYDNDHQPNDAAEKKLPPRWSAGGGWKADRNAFRHESDKGLDYLTYRHILRGSDKPELISDFVGYNAFEPGFMGRRDGLNWVGDLILECEVEIDESVGGLELCLNKGDDRFEARFDRDSGLCSLVRIRDGKEQTLHISKTSLRGRGTYFLRLANVDQRLTVWVNGTLPFGDGIPYDVADALMHGPRKRDLEPARIGFVSGGGVTVRHLKLWRDTYYIQDNRLSDIEGLRRDDPTDWVKDFRGFPFATYYVQPDHFFFLGDNSPESADSRFVGVVPRSLLLGKALFVYYPLDRVRWLP